MLVVQVQIHVLPEFVDAFIEASRENSRESLKEPGVARFDFLQNEAERTEFLLVEAYLTPDAPAAHKQTAHYEKWRDTVAPMMARPRTSVKYQNLHPLDAEYAMAR